MKRRYARTAHTGTVPVNIDEVLSHVSESRVLVYRALCATPIRRDDKSIEFPASVTSIETGARVVLSPRNSSVKITPVKNGSGRCPLRLAQHNIPDRSHELVAKYGSRWGVSLFLYRTWDSLFDSGSEAVELSFEHSLDKLARPPIESISQRLTGFGMIERGLVMLTDSLSTTGLEKFELGWNKFQRLKSLACRPSHIGEGQAATQQALNLATRLVAAHHPENGRLS